MTEITADSAHKDCAPTRNHSSAAPIDPRAIRTSTALRQLLLLLSAIRVGYGLAQIIRAWAIAIVIIRYVHDSASLTTWYCHGSTPVLVGLIAGMTVLLAAISYGQSYLCESATHKVIEQLAIQQGMSHLLTLDAHQFAAYSGGFLTQLSTNLDSVRPYFTQYLPALISTAIVLPMMVMFITLIDWPSGIIAIITIPLIPIFMILIGKLTQSLLESKMAVLAQHDRAIIDIFRGIPTLKALRKPFSASGYLHTISRSYEQQNFRMTRYVFLSSSVLEFLATFSVALVAVGIGMRLVSGKMLLVVAIMVLILIPEVYAPLRAVGSAYHASEDGQSFIATMLGIPQTSIPVPQLPLAADSHREICVCIDHASVHWPDGSIAPHDVSCEVEYGQIVLLVGENASGKTTLLRAIAGFIPLSSGQIRSIPHEDMILLPINPVLFPRDIVANIMAFTPQLSWSQAENIIDSYGFSGFLSHINMEQPINTLSQGQRQLVAILRVFLLSWQRSNCGHRVLILADEPTQYCDRRLSAHFFDTCALLAAQGVTFIIATHDVIADSAYCTVNITAITGAPDRGLVADPTVNTI